MLPYRLHCPPRHTAANPGLHIDRLVSGRRRQSNASLERHEALLRLVIGSYRCLFPHLKDLNTVPRVHQRPRFGDFSWRLTRPVLVFEGVELVLLSITR